MDDVNWSSCRVTSDKPLSTIYIHSSREGSISFMTQSPSTRINEAIVSDL